MDTDGLTAWWGSAQGGLEQGWTLASAPSGHGPIRIEVDIYGAEVHLLDSAERAFLVTPTQRVRYHGLKAWDRADKPLDVWLEPTHDGLVVVVDDTGAQYPVEVDPILDSTADWVIEASSSYHFLGATDTLPGNVSIAGDVNGDGYDDVAIGEPELSTIWVYMGGPDGLEATASWSYSDTPITTQLGTAVSIVGDIDDDGYDDLVVGAPNHENGQQNQGIVQVFMGSASGLETSPSASVEGEVAHGLSGFHVANAGDVNGDGYADVIARVDNEDHVFLGSSSGLDTTSTWSMLGTVHSQPFSRTYPAGDVNGDGYHDVLVAYGEWPWSTQWIGGAEGGWDYGQHTNTEELSVYLGSASGVETDASWTVARGTQEEMFGIWQVAADTNGDGYGDIVVSGQTWVDGASGDDGLYAYLGSADGLETEPSWTSGDTSGYWNEHADGPLTALDMDNDGFDDIVLSAVQILKGSAAGLEDTPSIKITSPGAEYSGFGEGVACGGDVNGDGSQDLLVGAPYAELSAMGYWDGAVLMYLGSSSTDTDGDGVIDSEDNCTDVSNPDQADADMDNYGNLCDADFNNDGGIGLDDASLMLGNLNTSNALYDLNGDGFVGLDDLNLLLGVLNTPPGPSGLE